MCLCNIVCESFPPPPPSLLHPLEIFCNLRVRVSNFIRVHLRGWWNCHTQEGCCCSSTVSLCVNCRSQSLWAWNLNPICRAGNLISDSNTLPYSLRATPFTRRRRGEGDSCKTLNLTILMFSNFQFTTCQVVLNVQRRSLFNHN